MITRNVQRLVAMECWDLIVRILSGNPKSVDRADRALYCYKCRPYSQRRDVWHRFEDLDEGMQDTRLRRLWNAIHPGEEDAVLNFISPHQH